MRRRRLALREIEEPPEEPHASDPESDAGLEEPNFNLLGFVTAAGGGGGFARAETATETAAQNGLHGGGDEAAPPHGAPSVFHLYQDGLVADQMLQLAFVRRRAPRSLRDATVRVEDEFVVPRPSLSLSDFMPSRVDIPLEKLWINRSASTTHSDNSTDTTPLDPSDQRRAIESGVKFFRRPRETTDEDVARWQRLAESDWRQAFEDSAPHGRFDVSDVCFGLERCPSAGLVQFVWGDLLVGLVEQSLHVATDDEDSEESAGRPTEPLLQQLRELLAVLVRHPSLAGTPPKQFRASVRAKNLRRIDEVIGTQLELEIISLFQQQRQQQRQQQQLGAPLNVAAS